MSELTITAAGFTIQPTVAVSNGPAILRWAYNRAFLDSDGIQVLAGTQTTGFGVEVPCSIAGGLVTVDDDSLLWTTDDAQDPAPLSILVSAWLLTPRGVLIAQLTIRGKAQFVVPSSLAPTTTWSLFSNYNQAVTLPYLNPSYYTAPQVDRLVRQWMDDNPASDTELGTVLLTVPADDPDQPVVWGANDPLVRDAIKLQGVDVDDTAPLDSQVLTYNQANNQWEPQNNASGTGNVISNEVSSVDGEIVLMSGTGGKTIKKGAFTGLLKAVAGVVAAAVAAVDYVAPGLITASGLTQTTGKLLGRSTASTGAVEEITVGTGLSLSGGTLSNTAADTGITQLTGDVTAGPGSGSQAATIANNAVTTAKILDANVTYAKVQDVSAADRLLGRGNGGGSGDVQEIQLGTNLSMSGTTLNASAGTGTVGNIGTLTSNQLIIGQGGTDVAALGSLGTTTTLLHGNAGGAPTFAAVSLTADVNGDLPLSNLAQASAASKLLGRGDSGAGDFQEISLGSGLSMSGTTLSASGGTSSFVGGAFETYKIFAIQVSPATTTEQPIGFTGAVSPIFSGSRSNQDDSTGHWIRYTTDVTSGTSAGMDANHGNLVFMGHLPQLCDKMRTGSSIASVRIWFGFFSADPASSSDPAVNALAFSYDTGRDGTAFWRTYSNDGSGGGTVTTTTQSIAVSTMYHLLLRVDSTSSVSFWISTDGGVTYTQVSTHTTNLPASSANMNYYGEITTLTTAAKFVDRSWTNIRSR